MSGSPIDQLLEAFDQLDLDRLDALIAPDARLLTADGQRAEGKADVRRLIEGFTANLRSTSHRVTGQWHQDGVWFAEVEASYELRDWLQLKALPRAFFLREGPDGISELHVYGAHERPLTEHRTGEEGMRIADHWIPPL